MNRPSARFTSAAHPKIPQGRSPLAQLLHALNQPLTGLQCSLELATSGPRPVDQYLGVLRDGLDLTARMRVLVDAMRELLDIQRTEFRREDCFALEGLIRETVFDLKPVAETRHTQISAACESGLWLRANRSFCAAWLFRLLDSTLSLSHEDSEVQIDARRNGGSEILLTLSWEKAIGAESPPCSRAELGFLIAEAAVERIEGDWLRDSDGTRERYRLRLPGATADSPELESRK